MFLENSEQLFKVTKDCKKYKIYLKIMKDLKTMKMFHNIVLCKNRVRWILFSLSIWLDVN